MSSWPSLRHTVTIVPERLRVIKIIDKASIKIIDGRFHGWTSTGGLSSVCSGTWRSATAVTTFDVHHNLDSTPKSTPRALLRGWALRLGGWNTRSVPTHSIWGTGNGMGSMSQAPTPRRPPMTCTLSVPLQIIAEIHEIDGGGYWAEVLRFSWLRRPGRNDRGTQGEHRPSGRGLVEWIAGKD